MRSHGASDDARLSFGDRERKDFLGAIEYLKKRKDVNLNKLAALGESWGRLDHLRCI